MNFSLKLFHKMEVNIVDKLENSLYFLFVIKNLRVFCLCFFFLFSLYCYYFGLLDLHEEIELKYTTLQYYFGVSS